MTSFPPQVFGHFAIPCPACRKPIAMNDDVTRLPRHTTVYKQGVGWQRRVVNEIMMVFYCNRCGFSEWIPEAEIQGSLNAMPDDFSREFYGRG